MSQVWFVTGCSTGFGRLLCQKLLDTGERVVATARDASSLDDLRAGDDDLLLKATLDVSRGVQIVSAVKSALERFGSVDVLVNNAGYGYFSTQEDGDIDEIRRMFETNVFGLIRVTQAVLPSMRQRRSGVIVNLSSVAGRVAFPRSGFYNASKFAVEALSESLYYEVAPFGIRMVVIEPGAYATDFGPRSAVRSPKLDDPTSPYAESARRWTEVASRLISQRQDPAEVVDRILAAVAANEPFMRLPIGRDAEPLVRDRESRTDAEFIRTMTSRYNTP